SLRIILSKGFLLEMGYRGGSGGSAIRMMLMLTNERERGCAMWDGGNITWGGRARVFGTVPVCVGVQEKAYGGEGVLAGRVVKDLESRYVHKGRTINISFYNDLSDDSVAKFTAIGICIYSNAWGLDELEKTLEKIKPYNSRLPALDDIQNLIHRIIVHKKIDKERNTIHKLPNQIKTNELFNQLRPCELVSRENVYFAIGNRDHTQAVIALMNLKANMAEHPYDERYKLVPEKMSSLNAKQPKKPPPKRTRDVEKSKRTQLSTSSSTESPPTNNEEFPSTKLSPRSYSRALKDDLNMSKEQRETKRMFKNLG
nr:hypothetical protein [Tanacetum cinerariifolium]